MNKYRVILQHQPSTNRRQIVYVDATCTNDAILRASVVLAFGETVTNPTDIFHEALEFGKHWTVREAELIRNIPRRPSIPLTVRRPS